MDQKLTWNPHLGQVLNEAALFTRSKVVGKKWGLKSKMTNWAYKAVIRPMVSYAALVWRPKVESKRAQAQLMRLHGFAGLMLTGATCTCPTAAMEAMLDLPPLPLHLEKRPSYVRLVFKGQKI